MYFIAGKFYFRMILVVLWLTLTLEDLLGLSLGEWDVAILCTLQFTPVCLQWEDG